MKRKTINSAMAFVEFLDVQAELLQAAKQTPLYSQMGKNLINRNARYVEEEMNKAVKNGFFDASEIELQMQRFANAGETIVEILQTSDNNRLQDFLDMLDAFKSGRYVINQEEEKTV